jgi:hypothetical protein
VLEQTHREHCAVLAAVEAGDGAAARRAMATHIRASKLQALAAHDLAQMQPESRVLPLAMPPSLLSEIDRIQSGRNKSTK